MIDFLLMTETQSKGARAAVFAVYGLVLIYIFYMLISTQQAMHSALHTKYKTETPHSAYHRFFINKRIFDIYMNKMLEIYDNKNQ